MQEYKYVFEVYKERSFSKAAKNLYVSQPALSATIKKIEDRLGMQLFDRSTTALALTQAGEAYIQTARKILNMEDDLQIYLNDLANLNTGSLVLAGTAFFSSYIIPPIVNEYLKYYPKVSLEFIEADSVELYKMAQDNQLDLIVDAGVNDKDRFERKFLYQETILLAVPKQWVTNDHLKAAALSIEDICNGKHRAEETEGVFLREFEQCPFILLKKEHDLYKRANEICKGENVVLSSFIHLNQLMTSFHLTCQNMGIALVSDSLVKCSKVNADVSFFKINVKNPDLIQREVFIAYRKSRNLTRAMKSFIDIAEKLYSNWS